MRAACLFFIMILISFRGLAEKSRSVDEECDDEPDENSDDECDDSIKDFVGTNLFGDDGCVKKCFSPEDVAQLMARKDFENLIPKDLPKCLLDDKLIEILMQYFYGANQVIVRMSNGNAKIFAQKAYYDALGGYLKFYLMPVTKYSFYAGIITLRTTINILQLYNQCKIFLNTNGNGWRLAITDFSEFDLTIEPIKNLKNPSTEEPDQTACINLNMADERTDNDDEMIVPLPRLDPEEYGLLSNIWMPFKRKHSFNLRSHSSAFILLRYYVTVSKCYQFQGVCQDTFNTRFKDWFQETIEIHLNDDILYPGLGAVLRILETVRHRKKFVPVKPNLHLPPQYSNKEKLRMNVRKQTQNYLKLKSKADKYSEPGAQNSFMEEEPKPKGPAGSKTNLMEDFVTYEDEDSSSVKARRKKYITIAVIISLFLLVFILAVAVITKYMSDRCNDDEESAGIGRKSSGKGAKDDNEKGGKGGKEKGGKGAAGKGSHEKGGKGGKSDDDRKGMRKKETLCEKLRRRGRKDDEVVLSKDSPSVVSTDKKGKKTGSTEQKSQGKQDSPRKKGKPPPPPQPKTTKKTESPQKKGSRSPSSTSASSSPETSKKATPRSPPPKPKRGLKFDTVDEKGQSKRFSISKKSKEPGSNKTSPSKPPQPASRQKNRANSFDSVGGRSRNLQKSPKSKRSSSWETID